MMGQERLSVIYSPFPHCRVLKDDPPPFLFFFLTQASHKLFSICIHFSVSSDAEDGVKNEIETCKRPGSIIIGLCFLKQWR